MLFRVTMTSLTIAKLESNHGTKFIKLSSVSRGGELLSLFQKHDAESTTEERIDLKNSQQ